MRYAERSSPGDRAPGLPRIEDHLETGVLHRRDEPRELGHPGLRRELQLVLRPAHRVEQPTHLRERGAARPLDVLQRLPVLHVLGGHPVPHRADLEDHDADRVGHDVVQLPGDPGPFLGHGDPGGALALPLGPDRALLRGLRLLGPLVQHEAHQPAHGEEQRGEDEAADRRAAGRCS